MTVQRFAAAFLTSVASIAVLVALRPNLLWSQTATPKTTSAFMRLKLEPAKQILEGIATEDYEMIARSSQLVHTLTLDEKWNLLGTELYSRNSQQFQKSVLSVLEAARNKNLDGAALAYVQMTLNCVNCHRDERGARGIGRK